MISRTVIVDERRFSPFVHRRTHNRFRIQAPASCSRLCAGNVSRAVVPPARDHDISPPSCPASDRMIVMPRRAIQDTESFEVRSPRRHRDPQRFFSEPTGWRMTEAYLVPGNVRTVLAMLPS
jgi:hypothetical protein